MRHRVYVCKAGIRISDITVPGEPPVLADAAGVRERITAAFPATDWNDPRLGSLKQGCFSLQFELPGPEDVTHLMLIVDHEHDPGACGAPADAVRGICTSNGWAFENLEEDGFLLDREV